MVPTLHSVGTCPRVLPTPLGFAKELAPWFLPVRTQQARPLPKSKHVLSPVGLGSFKYVPAKLDYLALYKWFSKLTRPVGARLTSSEYVRASEILFGHFSPWIVGGVASIEEVLDDIDMSRSPGHPYVSRGCQTKQQAWDKFAHEIIERVSHLLAGNYVECLFTVSPKDELLLKGKSARIFCPAPFHHQIACAVVFKHVCDSLTLTVGKHASAIGINIFGGGLERSFHRLSKHPYGYDADHSGWDVSLRDAEPERDFFKRFVPEIYHKGIDLLFNLALCPQVHVDSYVYQLCFQPSGWYLTTVVNTLKNYRQVMESFMDCYFLQYNQLCTITFAESHLEILVGGDDLAFSTDLDWFSVVKVAQWGKRRGIFLESDFLTPRNPMSLTFFSHSLFTRFSPILQKPILVAGGRMDKMISAFSYFKITDGKVDYFKTASRACALLMNLWAFEDVYNLVHDYVFHLVHHCFLKSGLVLTPEWAGLYRSFPSEFSMLKLWMGYKPETTFQSGLRDNEIETSHFLLPALKGTPYMKRVNELRNENKPAKQRQEKAPNPNERPRTMGLAPRLLGPGSRRPPTSSHSADTAVLPFGQKQTRRGILLPNSKVLAPDSAPPPTATTPREQKKERGFWDTLTDVASRGWKWLEEGGFETLLSIGEVILAAEDIGVGRIKHKRVNQRRLTNLAIKRTTTDQFGNQKMTDVLPAGTVLASQPISAQMFTDADGSNDRLERLLSCYNNYVFFDSEIVFTGAQGDLVNGIIGFFICPDPNLVITTTDSEAIVRLVEEYNGKMCKMNAQNVHLRLNNATVPLKTAQSPTADNSWSVQGTLFIVAITDIDTTDGVGVWNFKFHVGMAQPTNTALSLGPDVFSPYVDYCYVSPATYPNSSAYTNCLANVAASAIGLYSTNNSMIFGFDGAGFPILTPGTYWVDTSVSVQGAAGTASTAPSHIFQNVMATSLLSPADPSTFLPSGIGCYGTASSYLTSGVGLWTVRTSDVLVVTTPIYVTALLKVIGGYSGAFPMSTNIVHITVKALTYGPPNVAVEDLSSKRALELKQLDCVSAADGRSLSPFNSRQ